MLADDFDEHSNDKTFYSSALTTHSSSYPSGVTAGGTFLDEFCDNLSKDEDFPSDEQLEATSTSHCRVTIEFDPRLALMIENELGLNDPQTSRKNAWGNLSYAELIAKAIENSLDKRLTLSQIYSWMIQYVPYFRDKGDRKSSTGWKVSRPLPPSRSSLQIDSFFLSSPGRIPSGTTCRCTIVSFEFRMRSRASRAGGRSIPERNKSAAEDESNRMKTARRANDAG